MNVGHPCICCENSAKPEDHERCASVALMLLRNTKGEPFFDIEKAKTNCICFSKNPKLHMAIVNQLREQCVEKSASFELKPIKSENGLTVRVPRPKDALKSILDDSDGTTTDSEEDESEFSQEEELHSQSV